LKLRLLRADDIPRIAQFHSLYIPHSTFARMGIRFLRFIYRSFLRSRYGFVYTCCQRDQLSGYIAATTDTRGLVRSFFLSRVPLLCLISLGVLFRRPRLLRSFFATFFYSRKVELPQVAAELLFIAVTPEGRRQGIGTALILGALEELKRRGVDKVKVSVEKSNQGTIDLLHKMHFIPEKTFFFYHRERILFSYRIAQ
jgi:ribosomal protein S18 acetylase RimI-like enzyme